MVAAINEVKNGLENADVDGLATMEQVEACTEPEKPVGAGAIKELNNSLKIITYATEEPTEVAEGTIVMVYEE